MSVLDRREQERAHAETRHVDFYAEALKAAAAFRADYEGRLNLVKWQDMPFERSPDGLIKHIVNERMDTKECCIDIYMQFLPGGKASGKHRHLSEEIFYVVEGSGYDLHWDVQFDCTDKYDFRWAEEPRRFDWGQGDFVYIPPYCAHRHCNADPVKEARIIVINSRIVKAMGFDWFEQLEPAEGF
jgi:mannose-6-phosphate isomerase-like protein (cupin superfamily)